MNHTPGPWTKGLRWVGMLNLFVHASLELIAMGRFKLSAFPPVRIVCPICRKRSIKIEKGYRCRECGTKVEDVVKSQGSYRLKLSNKAMKFGRWCGLEVVE